MNGYWFNLALIAVLIVFNALLAGTEIALISLRESQLRRLRAGGERRATRLVRLAEDPNRFLATIQIGITLAGFLASATAAVALAEPLVPVLGFAGRAAEPLAIALVTLTLTFVTLVVGELAPKRLAMQYAQRWALLAATPLHLLAVVSRPAVWALSRATDLVVRALGGNPRQAQQPPSPEELRDMVISHRGLTTEQRTIISSALEIHERPLRAVLVPRRAVFSLSDDMRAAGARDALARSGHSRAPVLRAGHFDEVLGIVHLRDLTTAGDTTPVTELARPAHSLSDFTKITDALRQLMAARRHFAVVVDEYGSVEGIVTIEDLLEEIVGEIYDETDRDTATVRAQPDGSLLLPGSFPLHDLPDLGVDLGDLRHGPYSTVAGLVLARLGHVPRRPGESVRLPGWTIEVTGMHRNAITGVRLRPRRPRQLQRPSRRGP
ncbi:hemolysin family protein [Streptomyces aidingensis]|uniref:Putative hemolysin n=1 Tax=Streptomyces aidingensis TaxID=910347 RepID=A0A1I1U100_9ACTN|nr:hemolysin family protein [Streptomyces aidingensis]SFD64551.1 putative hemolysin [Streptomyces aidingensis]